VVSRTIVNDKDFERPGHHLLGLESGKALLEQLGAVERRYDYADSWLHLAILNTDITRLSASSMPSRVRPSCGTARRVAHLDAPIADPPFNLPPAGLFPSIPLVKPKSSGIRIPIMSFLSLPEGTAARFEGVRLGSMKLRGGIRKQHHVLVLVLVMLVVGLPLLGGRVLTGQDIVTYLINAQQMAANLVQGHFFPAWGGGFNAGYGSPALLFYPPLTSYIHAVPVLVGVPIIVGVWALALLAHLLSGLALWGWLRSAGFERSALPAAVVYMVAPYRFVDLYLRSALSEHWAFVWPPLLLWVASSPSLNRPKKVALTALLVAALLLTNLPMAVLFGVALAFWFFSSRRLSGMRLPVLIGVGLGFAVATFALVPQALSSAFLNTERYYGAAAGNFRPSANTLFSGGFGVWNLNTLFSLVLVLTGVLALAAFGSLKPAARRDRGNRLATVGVVAGVVIASGPMGPIWDVLPILSKLQFPWRISAVVTFIMALLVARLEPRRAWIFVITTIIAAAPFSSWHHTAPAVSFLPPRPAQTNPGSVFPDPFAAWQAGSGASYWRHETLAEPWLLPKNQKPFLLLDLGGFRAVELDLIRDRPAVMPDQPKSLIRVLEWGQTRRGLEIESSDGGTLLWRVISFPDMKVTVGGTEVPTTVDRKTGLLSHPLPAGKQIVLWTWRPFPTLRWARMVTVVALLTVAGLLGAACFGRVGSNREEAIR
jgi:hypothetical protein